jgi:hypothetical protein
MLGFHRSSVRTTVLSAVVSVFCATSYAFAADVTGGPERPVGPPVSSLFPVPPDAMPGGPQETPTTKAGSEESPHTGFKTLFKDVVRDFGHLPSKDNGWCLAIGGGLALTLHPLDDNVSEHFADSSGNNAFWKPGKVIGYGAVQIGAAIGTWAIGRATDKRGRVAHLGLDLLRAQIVTQTLTYGLKYSTRRDRPDGTGGYSFPSGHASTTFATATVLERHLGWKYAVPTYAIASYVAASRLYENRHFLSDVVFGAAVGLASGRTVTRHGRNNYALMPFVVPGGAGVAMTRVATEQHGS